ncbi:MAG: Ig-like domain repeat protein [Acidobacteriaceae bacterium]|nr:Ig-like domain repeat protein [Acidobacteriaceae bacterium]
MPTTLRAVAGGQLTNPTYPGSCPTSGYTLLDAYGDGCLATDVLLGVATSSGITAGSGPRFSVMDSAGNIFFSDYTNGLIRRIDAQTGVINTVAGGVATSPANTTCGSSASIDALGDGCLSTLVHLKYPEGLAFAPNGDLYFADSGQYDVRKISATDGLVPATGGVITNVAGFAGSGAPLYGYTVSNSTVTVTAATQSYLDAPYGVAFDAQGDLFIAEEYKNAILVVNTNTSGSTTVNGVTVPAGTIWKIAGAYGVTATATPASTCPNGTSGTFGCSYNPYVVGSSANATWVAHPYGLALDSTGNVYVANEYYESSPVISTSGILTTYAGLLSTVGTDITKRATAGSFGVGSNYGVAIEPNSGVFYQSDALNGVIWRVDPDTKTMYVIAGGASAVCSSASDTYGDGCPALQGTFGKSGTSYASNGVFGLSVDKYSDVLVGDNDTALIRLITTGANFGTLGSAKTNTLTIHFAANDSAASSTPYVITTGASNFAVGTPGSCTSNTDGSKDCLLPLTATPTVAGLTTGVLTVTTTAGATATFPLSLYSSPVTSTKLTVTSSDNCSGATSFSSSATLTATATVVANGDISGTVQFYDNGIALGDPVTLTTNGETATATLSQTFGVGNHSLTATYSGDSVFSSSSSSAVAFSTAQSSLSWSVSTDQQNTVTAGQTALYTLTLANTLYSGTLNFYCSGLPAGASCSFSPASLAVTSCDSTDTVALSIITSANATVLAKTKSLSGFGAGRMWTMFTAALLALLIGSRRRKLGTGIGTAAMLVITLLAATGLTACSSSITDGSIPTKSGTYTVTVTAAGTPATSSESALTQSTTVTLTIK